MPEFQFDSLAGFLAMGGDAVFVWASYGAFAAFIVWNLLQPRLQRRRIEVLLRARLQREAVLRERNDGTGSE